VAADVDTGAAVKVATGLAGAVAADVATGLAAGMEVGVDTGVETRLGAGASVGTRLGAALTARVGASLGAVLSVGMGTGLGSADGDGSSETAGDGVGAGEPWQAARTVARQTDTAINESVRVRIIEASMRSSDGREPSPRWRDITSIGASIVPHLPPPRKRWCFAAIRPTLALDRQKYRSAR